MLHRRAYRETSLLLDIFTREQGVRRLLAKGALRSRRNSQFGLLQPFVPLIVAWTGAADLAVLTEVESRGAAPVLAGKALFCGFYLNELLLRLLAAHDPHPDLFSFYEKTLSRLAESDQLGESLRFFELGLLEEIGYGLELEGQADTGAAIDAEKYYDYVIERGPLECAPHPGAIRGSTLSGLRAGHLAGPQEQKEARQLMRRVLHHHLGGRLLKSRELFKFSKFN